MRNANRGRTAGALKHATPQMKHQYMNQYLELKQTISESQPATNTCTECGQTIGSRPLYIPATDTRCYTCIRAAEIAKQEQAAAKPNHYDDVINGKVKMTAEYRAQLAAEYNARFTH